MSYGALTMVTGPGVPRGPGGALVDWTEKALEYLAEVVASKPEGRQQANGIAAANALLAHFRWSCEQTNPDLTLAELAGNEERLLEWMRRVMPILEARVAAKKSKALTTGGETGGEQSR